MLSSRILDSADFVSYRRKLQAHRAPILCPRFYVQRVPRFPLTAGLTPAITCAFWTIVQRSTRYIAKDFAQDCKPHNQNPIPSGFEGRIDSRNLNIEPTADLISQNAIETPPGLLEGRDPRLQPGEDKVRYAWEYPRQHSSQRCQPRRQRS